MALYYFSAYFIINLLAYFFAVGATVSASYASLHIMPIVLTVSVQTIGAFFGTTMLRLVGPKNIHFVAMLPLFAAVCVLASIGATIYPAGTIASLPPLVLRAAAGTVLLAVLQAVATDFSTLPIERLNRNLQICSMIAFILALATAPLLAAARGSQLIFALDAVGNTILLLLLFAIKQTQITSSRTSANADMAQDSTKPVHRILALTGLVYAAGGVFQVVEVPILKTRFDMSPMTITLIFVATGIANLLAVRFAPRSLLRHREHSIHAAALSMIAATSVFIVSPYIALIPALVFTFGAANGLFTLMQASMIQGIVNLRERAQAFLLARLASQIGILVGCSLVVSTEATGHSPVLGLCFIVALATGSYFYRATSNIPRPSLSAVLIPAALTLPFLASNTAQASRTLHLPLRAIPQTIDPMNLSDVSSASVTYQLFEHLFAYDANNVLVPQLAKHYTFGADGLSININLHPDHTFSDGTPVTADHVVSSLTRSAAILGEEIFWAMRDISGFEDFIAKKSQTISGVTTTAKHSLRIELLRTSPRLLQIFAAWFAVGLEKDGKWLGSGAYEVHEFVPGKTLSLRSRTRTAQPYIDKVVYVVAETQEKQVALVRSGAIDIALFDSSVALEVPNYERHTKDFLQTVVMAINSNHKNLSDPSERCNLVSAIKAAAADAGYHWHPINQGLPFAWNIFSGSAAKPPNKSRANSNIEILLTDSAATFETTANDRLATLLKGFGYSVKTTKLPVRSLIERLKKRTYDAALFGYVLDYADPDALFLPLLGTAQQYNFVGLSDPAIDALLDVSHNLTDRESRNIVFRSIVKRMENDCRVSLVGSQKQVILIRNDLKIPALSSFGFYRLPLASVNRRD